MELLEEELLEEDYVLLLELLLGVLVTTESEFLSGVVFCLGASSTLVIP